jgi:hypothetical protein
VKGVDRNQRDDEPASTNGLTGARLSLDVNRSARTDNAVATPPRMSNVIKGAIFCRAL